jgi:hypothetical protein
MWHVADDKSYWQRRIGRLQTVLIEQLDATLVSVCGFG